MSDRIGPLTSVSLYTTEDRFAAMRTFYVDTLGLTPSADRALRTAFDWRSGDLRMRLILMPHSELDGPARDPYRTMLNFQVDDIDTVAARLRAQGIAFLREPSPESWGRVATVADPDGNLVQLFQPAD